uniref:uncharacterized protein LOC104266160 n=1 Tax=Ciona intestinalis TaxID=7719 RepID=UPI000521AEC7|nr:uncharacterized protein LOC104266160 [Ciona intestinalis]|eukprot:XP_009860047.1 uncharacterized protein LOC104266160 [Ciona intestinalis]
MLTEKQLRMLRSAVVYDASKVPTDLPEFNVTDESSVKDLQNKTNRRLDKIKHKLQFDEYNFIEECDIGSLTGKQILQLFMKILNDPTKYIIGNCLLFSVNEKAEVAFAINDTRFFEVQTAKRENLCDKSMYEKIFDDGEVAKYLKENKSWSIYFSPDEMRSIRNQVPNHLHTFMNDPVGICDTNYRRAFLGMLQEVARVEIHREGAIDEVVQLQQVPVAACVKLAVESQQTGKLQQVFGSHGIHKKITHEIKRKHAMEHGAGEISGDELYKRTLQEKKRLKFEAAEEIIQSFFMERNEDRRYNDDVIEQVANDVREFFM